MLNAFSIVGYLGMVGGLFGLLATQTLFSNSPFVISAQVAATLLMLWARVTFRSRSFHLGADPTAGGLVTGGPYRYIRHPIYAAVCLFTLAGTSVHLSWETVLCGTLVLGGAILRIFCEETLVVARYPEYQEYATRTWRMIPYVF